MKDNSRNNYSLKVLSHQVLKDHYDHVFVTCSYCVKCHFSLLYNKHSPKVKRVCANMTPWDYGSTLS